jgi:hypothetical protein
MDYRSTKSGYAQELGLVWNLPSGPSRETGAGYRVYSTVAEGIAGLGQREFVS